MPEADAKFLNACQLRGAAVQSFVHPRHGPAGELLQTLVARVGARDAPDVLVLISGTHGIEGYCGAGVQTGLLDVLSEFSLPPTLAVVFVHMINPWGCAWDRRENEDNIDIFRNLLYCDPPYRPNAEYDSLAEAICPVAWSTGAREAADRRLTAYDAEHGAGAWIGVARRGQHDHPSGLTFHGRDPSWSKRTCDDIVRHQLTSAKRVLNFDLHTGYGEYGEGVVVCCEPPTSPTARRLSNWFGADLLYLGADPIIPAHPGSPYDVVCGNLAADVTSFALEYGTENVTGIFDLLREASWVFNYGDPLSAHGRAVRARYRALFYPERDDWKRLVWARGREVFEHAVAALATPWVR
ncbi:MAG: DUF2817 domain-containing protein [Phycisphaerae bacterium]|nr:DUF2817 domain-containing protein [Phycisphaerae bacterium]